MVEYKTVLNKETGELTKVEISNQQTAITSDEGEIDINDPKSLKTACMEELGRLLKKFKGNLLVLPVIKEIMDREFGKAPQSLNTTINGNINNTIQIVRFSDLPVQVDNKIIDHVDNS